MDLRGRSLHWTSIAIFIVGVGVARPLSAEPAVLGVMPIAGEANRTFAASTRTQMEASLRAVDGFRVLPTAELDRVLRDLSAAGILCTGRDETCWLRLAVNAGLDVVVVGVVTRTAGARVLDVHMLDARGARPRSASGVMRAPADAADVARRLLEPPAPVTADPAPGGSTAAMPTPRAPIVETADASIVPIVSFSVAGLAAIAAVGCGIPFANA